MNDDVSDLHIELCALFSVKAHISAVPPGSIERHHSRRRIPSGLHMRRRGGEEEGRRTRRRLDRSKTNEVSEKVHVAPRHSSFSYFCLVASFSLVGEK